ncbi:hypothetical protein MKX03_016932 [Papaver bracteatum]|nr:hypothetical protein MKX03_016932 [Papaver bracteatum]
MARNSIGIFSTVFLFVMINMASFTAQMALSAPESDADFDAPLVDSSTVSKNLVRKPDVSALSSLGPLTKSTRKIVTIGGGSN